LLHLFFLLQLQSLTGWFHHLPAQPKNLGSEAHRSAHTELGGKSLARPYRHTLKHRRDGADGGPVASVRAITSPALKTRHGYVAMIGQAVTMLGSGG
jgi:hypothetical protein